jgi:urease accessory protein
VPPTITTITRTEAPAAPRDEPSAAILAVDGGGVRGLRQGARLAPRVLARRPVVRAALVPVQAGPLDGDHDVVRLHVGAGATLVMVPIAATLALPGASRLELHATVEAGGRLLLDDAPLIVAAGAAVERRTRIELAAGAVAAVRDVVVLGRAGEPPGALDSELRATLGGRPLLHDALRLDPRHDDAHVALPPGHRVAATIALLGERDPAEPELAGPGALRRASAPELPPVDAALDETWERWEARIHRRSVAAGISG